MPGVLLVLTGADVLAEGLKPIPHIPQAMSPPDIRLDNLDGSPHLLERPMILATDSVRFVGEGVAFVVAETRGASQGRRRSDRGRLRDPAADGRHRRRCPGRQSAGDPRRLRRGRIRRAARDRHPARSPACRWSRAPRWAPTIRRPAATRSMPAAVRWCGRRRSSRSSSASSPSRSASSPRRPAATSAPATSCIPSSCWSPGRRRRSAGRSNGPASAARHFSATMPPATCGSKSELAISADGKFLGLHATATSNVGAYTASYIPLTKGTQLMTSVYDMPATARARAVLSNTQSHRALSQRRPARDHVRDRAADRHGRARIRLRPGRAAPPQPHHDRRRIATPSASPTTAATMPARSRPC